MTAPVLEVSRLGVCIGTRELVSDVSFSLVAGGTVALVGQSGSGKSLTAAALIGLLPQAARMTGSVRLAGRELTRLTDEELCRVRGRQISMVFQDPSASLTPVHTVGRQLAEALTIHQRLPPQQAWRQAVELLDQVGIACAAERAHEHPHRFSGGMRQRVCIAMALANRPAVIIADEPTSALDRIIVSDIMQLLAAAQQQHQTSLLLITHDRELARRHAEQVLTMAEGRLVPTTGPSAASVRPPARNVRPVSAEPALQISGLSRRYRVGRTRPWASASTVTALDHVSLTVAANESVAIVGESGSGKSTLLREVLSLRPPTSGRIEVLGHDLATLAKADRAQLQRQIQFVAQDPHESLDPAHRIEHIIEEPLRIQGLDRQQRQRRVAEVLELVELPLDHRSRRPGQLSGGQRQRVAIARALAPSPRLLLLDEPVSSLDFDLRLEVMELLARLQEQVDVAHLLVTHDPTTITGLVDRIAVMRTGRIVECGPLAQVLYHPQDPYTRRLLSA